MCLWENCSPLSRRRILKSKNHEEGNGKPPRLFSLDVIWSWKSSSPVTVSAAGSQASQSSVMGVIDLLLQQSTRRRRRRRSIYRPYAFLQISVCVCLYVYIKSRMSRDRKLWPWSWSSSRTFVLGLPLLFLAVCSWYVLFHDQLSTTVLNLSISFKFIVSSSRVSLYLYV